MFIEKGKRMKYEKNELKREFLSVCGLNPFPGFDSSSRIQMFSSHIGQKLVINGATERRIQTGMEGEFGKYTFSIKMPVNGHIIKMIQRYRQNIGIDSINITPQTVIIFENEVTKEVGVINIPLYCSYHQYFGFNYKFKPAVNNLTPGTFIPEGTIFADSPGVTNDGGYAYGRELNVALMSHPSVSEDGFMICRDVLPYLSFQTFESRTAEFGSRKFPLNLYGTVDNFKAFPDIGEYVREDGLLMMLRDFDKNLAPVNQSVYDLMEPDHIFDRAIYAPAGGKIIDIKIFHEDSLQSPTPVGMEKHITKYDTGRRHFYGEILREWRRLNHERGAALSITPEFHRLVIEAMSVVGTGFSNNDNSKIQKIFRKSPIDDYRIEFIIEQTITPTIGFKLTDCHGGKGVICKIAEPDEMPFDEAGNRADLVLDGNSKISRMNLGGLYEPYINAAARDVVKHIKRSFGLNEKEVKISYDKLIENKDLFQKVKDYLLGFYAIVSPKMYDKFAPMDVNLMAHHFKSIIKEGIYIYYPTDNDPEGIDIVTKIEKFYKPTYGPLTYKTENGYVKTDKPIRIGSTYIMLLEKIGDDLAAVNSAKLQHFGILSQLTKADRNSQPLRNQPVRANGETEGRILASCAGPYAVAEIMDRNNNPFTHKHIVWNILKADKPTNIINVVDRKIIGLGNAKPLQLVSHIAFCGGWKFKYVKE